VVLLILILSAPAASETDLPKMKSGMAESKKNLGAIQKKIQEEKKRVRDMDRKESSVITQLNRLDQNLAQKEKERRALDQRLKAVTRKVEKASEDLGILNQSISTHERHLMERLVALYKFRDWELPEMIFSSHSYEDLKTHQRFLAMILDQDRQLIEDFRKREERVRSHREQLQADEKELQQLKKKTEKKKEEIQKDRAKKEQLLRSVREEKKVHLAAIQELETASIQLQALIDKLEKQIRAREKERLATFSGKGFAAARGKLPFPVQGRILSTFGKNENPQFNTFSVQKGIEIEAPQGRKSGPSIPGESFTPIGSKAMERF
jgi:septal ring factor EnvC (AmiA/AmiB activator)